VKYFLNENVKTQQCYVVFRGTDRHNLENLRTALQIFTNAIDNDMTDYEEQCAQWERTNGPISLVCGHSLGGYIAERVNLRHAVTRVTFNIPRTVTGGVVAFTIADDLIASYRSTGNRITVRQSSVSMVFGPDSNIMITTRLHSIHQFSGSDMIEIQGKPRPLQHFKIGRTYFCLDMKSGLWKEDSDYREALRQLARQLADNQTQYPPFAWSFSVD